MVPTIPNLKLVKRGINQAIYFHSEYGKPGGIKIKVTFDALNKVSGLHRALLSSFLGDLVCEHIGLKILSWKKVDKESRDKLWDEITIENKEIEADDITRVVECVERKVNKD
ncbi:hypothetical protein Tco_1336318 [Tanacetum coccineum]